MSSVSFHTVISESFMLRASVNFVISIGNGKTFELRGASLSLDMSLTALSYRIRQHMLVVWSRSILGAVMSQNLQLPDLTHAEVVRRMQREIDRVGGQAAAARLWGISQAWLTEILQEKKNIGPKLLKALKLRRITLVVHRYAPAKSGVRRVLTVRKLSRGAYTDRRHPD